MKPVDVELVLWEKAKKQTPVFETFFKERL
jgi:hypothetical protein